MKIARGPLLIASTIALALPGLYFLRYSVYHKVFTITGDVVDEQGRPIDTGVAVTEGQFISITQNSYRTHFEPTPNGKFSITTEPCSSVTVMFGMDGFGAVHLSYGRMSDIPKPLHIIMHRAIPATAHRLEPSPVGEFEIDTAKLHWSGSAYQRVLLRINADGTATTVTTLADNKTKVIGTGTWTPSLDHPKDRITVLVNQPDGAPDPANLSEKTLRLDLADDGIRLIQRGGGPPFYRVKQSPANLP